MNRIELSGKSQGKGRNGYFQLHSVELMNLRELSVSLHDTARP
jgi:hypothetical protein